MFIFKVRNQLELKNERWKTLTLVNFWEIQWLISSTFVSVSVCVRACRIFLRLYSPWKSVNEFFICVEDSNGDNKKTHKHKYLIAVLYIKIKCVKYWNDIESLHFCCYSHGNTSDEKINWIEKLITNDSIWMREKRNPRNKQTNRQNVPRFESINNTQLCIHNT